jgi:glucose dehydrogenase
MSAPSNAPRLLGCAIVILAIAWRSPNPSRAQDILRVATETEWRSYGHDPGGMRFSPLDQINRTNVPRLERAWTFHAREVTPETRNSDQHPIPSFEATPPVVDGVL